MGESASPERAADPEFGALTGTFPARFREGSRKRALVYENGLVLVRRGGTADRFSFADVQVKQEIVDRYLFFFKVSTAYRFTLTGPDGRKRVLTNFGYRRIGDLGNAIQTKVVQAQAPGVLTELRRGGRIDFGPLYLSAKGIGNRRRLVPWNGIRSVGFHQGFFQVVGENGIAADVKRIPNVHVLHAVAQSVLGGRGR